MPVMPVSPLHAPLLAWYGAHARELPWRSPDRTPWGVLVSEVMLQQTPVPRVVPAWLAWMQRWPTPSAQAEASLADVLRQWGRLGYPRRARRLHEAAVTCVVRFEGEVPAGYDDLRSLPGVGDYTARAVQAFAFGQRSAPLDTNVRRVLARLLDGDARPSPSVRVAEQQQAEDVLPDDGSAPRWSIALMELGALVCTSTSPQCEQCPLASHCAWLAAGRPPHEGPRPRVQRFAGTDRQVRGLLLAALRDSDRPLPRSALDAVWPDDVQRMRALDGLVADGLVEPLPGRRYALPGSRSAATPAARPS
jgi:A/G-specific adenine glycosylase